MKAIVKNAPALAKGNAVEAKNGLTLSDLQGMNIPFDVNNLKDGATYQLFDKETYIRPDGGVSDFVGFRKQYDNSSKTCMVCVAYWPKGTATTDDKAKSAWISLGACAKKVWKDGDLVSVNEMADEINALSNAAEIIEFMASKGKFTAYKEKHHTAAEFFVDAADNNRRKPKRDSDGKVITAEQTITVTKWL